MSDEQLWDSMNEQLDQEYPESFIFDEGENDRILGTFVRVDTGPSQYTDSGKVPIYVVKDKSGKEFGLWGIHQVLRENFQEKQPQPGDLVGVKYLGKVVPRAGGNGYHSYKIVVQRQGTTDPSIDWSLYGDVPTIAPAEDAEELRDPTTSTWGQPAASRSDSGEF